MQGGQMKQNVIGALQRAAAFSKAVIQNFSRDKCLILASSVVYSTLISAVPFLAFIISLLTAFGMFDVARQSLIEIINTQFGELLSSEITSLINTFVSNAANLGVVGLVSFLIASLILINRVWVAINQIYHASQNRNRIARFSKFLTFLIVGTLLLSAYISVNAILNSFLSQFFVFGIFWKIIGTIGPWLIILILLFMLVYYVPNTKVRFFSAVLGALVGTICFQAANLLFSTVVLRVVDYSIIYGSFASILIFLIWIYMWWLIIFGAAEVAYVHQYRPDMIRRRGLPNPPSEQIAYGIDILCGLAEHYRQGKGAVNVRELGNELKIPDKTLYTYLDLLENAGFILKIDRPGHLYIPARPLDDMDVSVIAQTLYGEKEEGRTPGDHVAFEVFSHGVKTFNKTTLKDLTSRNSC
jgi:membrane protein